MDHEGLKLNDVVDVVSSNNAVVVEIISQIKRSVFAKEKVCGNLLIYFFPLAIFALDLF